MNTAYKLKPVHVRRLRKLIAFLRQLPRKRFNFAIIRNEPPKCGAVGCAIGYMPNVFPRTFQSFGIPDGLGRWTHHVGFRGREYSPGSNGFMAVAKWVSGLGGIQASDLFTPNLQQCVHDKLKPVPTSATPKQVARMLEKFIQLHA
jgi:hypothetical protein